MLFVKAFQLISFKLGNRTILSMLVKQQVVTGNNATKVRKDAMLIQYQQLIKQCKANNLIL